MRVGACFCASPLPPMMRLLRPSSPLPPPAGLSGAAQSTKLSRFCSSTTRKRASPKSGASSTNQSDASTFTSCHSSPTATSLSATRSVSRLRETSTDTSLLKETPSARGTRICSRCESCRHQAVASQSRTPRANASASRSGGGRLAADEQRVSARQQRARGARCERGWRE